MKKRKEHPSRDVGLEMGLEIASLCGRYFLKLRHLHYGYWPSELEVDVHNLHIAQEKYVQFLISQIPTDVNSILDVGCGLGQMAKDLNDSGFSVDCVSPSPFLTEQAHKLLGRNSHIFPCRYEELQTEKRYDLVLFSESFQYVNLVKSFETTARLLTDGGYMLICDVFRKEVRGNSAQHGGHKLSKFYTLVKNYPFVPIKDIDITDKTAPTLDILEDALKNVAQPVVDSGFRFLSGRYPLIYKLLRWKYRKQIAKVDRKYFRGQRDGQSFKKFKSYKCMLYRKSNPV